MRKNGKMENAERKRKYVDFYERSMFASNLPIGVHSSSVFNFNSFASVCLFDYFHAQNVFERITTELNIK